MVPFADLFNHKAAIVDLAEGYAIEAGEMGDDMNGDTSEEEEEEEEEEEGEESPSGSPAEDVEGGDGLPARDRGEADNSGAKVQGSTSASSQIFFVGQGCSGGCQTDF